MSHVDFKKRQCRMSLSLIFPDVPYRIYEIRMSLVVIFFACRMSVGFMTRVNFKKWPCHRVDFRGLDP